MYTVGKEAKKIGVHQNLRVLSRHFLHGGSCVIDNRCKLLELHAFVFIFLMWLNII